MLSAGELLTAASLTCSFNDVAEVVAKHANAINATMYFILRCIAIISTLSSRQLQMDVARSASEPEGVSLQVAQQCNATEEEVHLVRQYCICYTSLSSYLCRNQCEVPMAPPPWKRKEREGRICPCFLEAPTYHNILLPT